MRSIIFAVTVTVLIAAAAQPAAAEAPLPHGPDPDSWHFSLGVYAWVPGIDGSLSGGRDGGARVESDVSMDLSDAIDGWGAGTLHAEVGRGPLTFFGDVLYVSLQADGETPSGGEANVDLSALIIELGVTYEVIRTPVWGTTTRHFTAEVLGGARYAGVEVEVDAFPAGGGQLSADGREDWIDPFVGLRARLDLTDNLYVLGRGDVGGFGVGSDFVWNANLAVGFAITKNIDIAGGYRWLDYDFEEGDFTLDLQFAGPWIGIFFKF